MSPVSHAVSAPGKVLLAGGYLVIDPSFTGLVFGLDARIHVIIQDVLSTGSVSLSEIAVRSPQFDHAAWHYSYRAAGKDAGVEVTQLNLAADHILDRNPFVETTLRYALSYVASTANVAAFKPASITILADNDYYTTPASSKHGERFYRFDCSLSNANKTGLGSSAALVTALTAALLRHYLHDEATALTSVAGEQRLHNLAQAAHCAAQGKVGSGFDVASAVFGSCVYRRFSPDILSTLPEPGITGFASALKQTVDGDDIKWDYQIQKDTVSVPKGLRLVMCDVSCGSQTPGMVKKVLAWRKKEAADAEKIWSALHAANLNLTSQLQAVGDHTKDYSQITVAFKRMRQQIRLMGDGSDVPIEPPAQTRLLDACCDLPGVIGGTVPGAGGYDAIVLLVKDQPEVFAALNQLFAGWTFDGTDGGQGKVSMLGVREEMAGIRDEDARSYAHWIKS